MIWQTLSLGLVLSLGLSLGSPTKTIYFPDPKNDSKLISAYLDGQPPDVDALFDNSTITFHLVTPYNIGDPQQIIPYDLESVENSSFIPNAPLKIMAHGFGSSSRDRFPTNLANAFLNRALDQGDDLNIILIDWSILAAKPWYTTAAPATKLVAKTAANLLNFLMDEDLVTIDQIHAIGYSLGAHVAGNIGHELEGKVPRVTGLDPALPLFDITPDSNRIDPSDGIYVEIVHTSSGHLHENGLSFLSTRGHADFYPNSGTRQPGCEREAFGGCSHGRSHDYYAESITKPEDFYACSCGHWDLFLAGRCDCSQPIYFGISSPNSARGKYYFLTNDTRPFGLGKNGLVNVEGEGFEDDGPGGSGALVPVYGMFLLLVTTSIHKLFNL